MSKNDHQGKATREERLAANLRANLRRRKQAARKVKVTPAESESKQGLDSDKSSP